MLLKPAPWCCCERTSMTGETVTGKIISKEETTKTFAGYYKMHISGSMKEQYDKIRREYYLKHHDMTLTGVLSDSAD